mmetsp:Transcript_39852/g.96172  ORF Transcript_39852/g.96172 Transcript_39852/m.96172 type:complete len:243 (-) Transcript_39852:158-886(-)
MRVRPRCTVCCLLWTASSNQAGTPPKARLGMEKAPGRPSSPGGKLGRSSFSGSIRYSGGGCSMALSRKLLSLDRAEAVESRAREITLAPTRLSPTRWSPSSSMSRSGVSSITEPASVRTVLGGNWDRGGVGEMLAELALAQEPKLARRPRRALRACARETRKSMDREENCCCCVCCCCELMEVSLVALFASSPLGQANCDDPEDPSVENEVPSVALVITSSKSPSLACVLLALRLCVVRAVR